MALNIRNPIWLPAAPAPGIGLLATLYMVECMARASVATVIPIQAYRVFGDEQAVSFAYSAVGLFSLCYSLALPALVRRLSRRWTYTLGGALLIAAAAGFATGTLLGQVSGMVLRVFGVASLNVALTLYVLELIRRQDYVRNDSTRMTLAMVSWVLGPAGGVWLLDNHGVLAPFLFSAGCSAFLIGFFWWMRLTERTPKNPRARGTGGALRHVGRFARQPRLRLAWTIAFARSSFWSTAFVYAPILMLLSDWGREAGGWLVSGMNALLAFSMLWGRISNRLGVRPVVAMAFVFTALALFVAAWAGTAQPALAAGMLLVAAFWMVPLDAVGTTVFYRAVHPGERAEMSAVYRTYLDIGELLPPLLYGALLGLFGLGAVFAALGCLLLVTGGLSWRYLHRRL